MIKSVVEENVIQKEISYPCIMKGKQSGVIVLFECDGYGTVIGYEGEYYSLGEHNDMWDMNSFELFNGEVTLSNTGPQPNLKGTRR